MGNHQRLLRALAVLFGVFIVSGCAVLDDLKDERRTARGSGSSKVMAKNDAENSAYCSHGSPTIWVRDCNYTEQSERDKKYGMASDPWSCTVEYDCPQAPETSKTSSSESSDTGDTTLDTSAYDEIGENYILLGIDKCESGCSVTAEGMKSQDKARQEALSKLRNEAVCSKGTPKAVDKSCQQGSNSKWDCTIDYRCAIKINE